MVEFVTGDIFEAKAAYIAHGVATGSQEGLGTGLALKISAKRHCFLRRRTTSRLLTGESTFLLMILSARLSS
jgi:hypothetical protein